MVTVLSIDGGPDFLLAPSLARSIQETAFWDHFFSSPEFELLFEQLASSLATKKALEKLASTLLAPTFAIHTPVPVPRARRS